MSDGTLRCDSCGLPVAPTAAFCGACGSKAGAAAGSGPRLDWEAELPLLTHPFMLRAWLMWLAGTAVVVGLIFTGIWLFGGRGDFPFQVLLPMGIGLGVVLVLLLFVVFVLFGNRIAMRYTLSDAGVRTRVISETARTGRRLGLLAGLFGGITTAGSALIASSRTETRQTWDEFDSASLHPRWRTIAFRHRGHVAQFVQCTNDNFDEVAAAVRRWVAVDGPGGARQP